MNAGGRDGSGANLDRSERVSTYLMGLPFDCNGENASVASFAYDSLDFTWTLQTSGETHEKFKEHIASFPENDESPVSSARVSSASRIRWGTGTEGGRMSLRTRGRRARNFESV